MNRQPGYYWVRYTDWTGEPTDYWYIALYAKSNWICQSFPRQTLQDDFWDEINENRIPAPNEEAGIDTLGRCIADLILSKSSFTWDAETNNITYKLKGTVKIASATVIGGFDFGSDDKRTGTMNGANATDGEEGNKV